MKTNLIRLMAIATLATTMSFASEKDTKATKDPQAAGNAASMQKKEAGKKVRTEKQKKSESAEQQNISALGIWG